MRHLVTKREAAERKRAALMSEGIAKFLDMTAEYRNVDVSDIPEDFQPKKGNPAAEHTGQQPTTITETPAIKDSPAQSSVLEKIRKTLDQAAEILRESLEITTGGVVFLDTALANTEVKKLLPKKSKQGTSSHPYTADLDDSKTESSSPGPHLSRALTRSFEDKYNAPKILAASVPKASHWEAGAPSLNPQTLARLIAYHTTGNVWSIDEDGAFSSFREVDNWERQGLNTPEERRDSLTQEGIARSKFEAEILSEIFPKARQIVFLPLWDAGSSKLWILHYYGRYAKVSYRCQESSDLCLARCSTFK
jgi:hypothetical protein